MSKIYFQGTFGAYSHLAALSIEPNAAPIRFPDFAISRPPLPEYPSSVLCPQEFLSQHQRHSN